MSARWRKTIRKASLDMGTKSIILTALRLTQTHGPQPTTEWNSGERCVAFHHAELFSEERAGSCPVKECRVRKPCSQKWLDCSVHLQFPTSPYTINVHVLSSSQNFLYYSCVMFFRCRLRHHFLRPRGVSWNTTCVNKKRLLMEGMLVVDNSHYTLLHPCPLLLLTKTFACFIPI